jgi:DNA primase
VDAGSLQVLLNQIGISTVLGSNGWLRGRCPYHNDNNPSWGILTTADHHPYSCFACKAHGNLYRLLIDIGRFSEEKSRKISLTPSRINSQDIHIERREMGMWPIDESELYPFSLTKIGANYLRKRGIDPVMAEKLGVVYEPEMHRILFPWKFNRKLFGVTGRSLDPLETVRTLPLYGTLKGHLLYLPFGKINVKESLILCEGEIDALKIVQAGYDNVAAFGFGDITSEQAILIQAFSNEAICFCDDDQAGEMLAEKVHEKLAGRIKISSVDWPVLREKIEYGYREKIDPGNMTLDEIQTALRTLKRNSDFPDF